ncbi:hypothetical protein GSI_03064 [Ganoderma sinense ZZ0214-1]|uniref:Uncharacterized protein n=1 Tax=Ganoderma sinense ZZ0214-1 TaxID=1077348 RepID=A0A2G8SKJ9_9APHY|nr:hypothetical protein GSI_03064 [Ganoderma sinense ZZ0214-1]
MAPIFAPTIVLPPYALALFIAVVVSLLAATATWIFLVHRRRFSLHIPTTPVEAQVQVQVQVEKIHDPTPPRSSSWLGRPFVPCTASSPSDSWFQRILRRNSNEPGIVPLSDPPPAERHTPTLPPLDDCQPPSPRPVKKEMWFAFDSDATLATLRGDPLGGFYFKASCRDPVSTSTASTPSLIYDKSTPPSPLSSLEPLTPPPMAEEDLTYATISVVTEIPSKSAFQKNEETDHACPSPLLAPEETRLSLPSMSMASSVCTLIHDTPSIPEPGDIYLPAHESDCDVDLKVSCKRLAALIDAISVSFSASTLGPPFSRRTTKLDFGDCDFDFDDNSFSIGDDCDLPQCGNDDDPEPEWDLGTTALHESISQGEYSVLAI